MNISEKLSKMGYPQIDGSFYDYISTWDSWYKGNVASFHTYKVFTGQKYVQCHRYSMGMAKKVCEDWANLLMNEKVKITAEGNQEQEIIDAVFAQNDFETNANELQEKGAALGTYAMVLKVEDVKVNADTGKVAPDAKSKIKIDYLTAKNIFPLAWSNREITECAFTTPVAVGGKKYLYMQMHVIDGNEYVIKNRMFRLSKGDNSTLQDVTEDEMHAIQGYETVPAEIHTGTMDKQFVIGRLNIANNLDENNPMGISVYANAIDALMGVDVAYDSYINEFVLGKKRIMVKPAAAKNIDGEPNFDPNDLTYYVLPEDVTDGDVIKEIDMKLRTAEHSTGLRDQLNVLSNKCGFGNNHYQFENGNISTATQIISENSEMYRTLKKHEGVLKLVIKKLCRAILLLAKIYTGAQVNPDVEINIDFDDSIIEDKNADFERDMRLLSAGIMSDVEFRMKWLNEDETTARKMLPGVRQLTRGVEIVERE